MNNKVLVIAPHPDDEVLGCGGTLLRHSKLGDEIYWVIVTHIHREHGWSGDQIQQCETEIKKVSTLLGFKKYYNLNFPAAMLDTQPYNHLVPAIRDVIHEVEPSVVYLPNRCDIHTDHEVVFNAAMSCCKNFRAPFIKKILMYETLSETEFSPALPERAFIPNVFVDISSFYEKKIEALKLYPDEMMESPFPRSVETVEALARYRGSRIGKKYAEAFMLIEEIL